jgi:hypothetical protein
MLDLPTAITLKVAPFQTYAPFPALLKFLKCILQVVFCEGVQHCLQFCLNHLSCVEMVVSSAGETEKLQGAKLGEQGVWEMTVMLFMIKNS